MSNTQSIIVYTNPAQAAFWEGGYFIPLCGGLLVGALVFVALYAFAERLVRRIGGRVGGLAMGAAVVAGISAGVFTFSHLML